MPSPRIFRLAFKLLFAFGVLAVGFSLQLYPIPTAILQCNSCGAPGGLEADPVAVREHMFQRGWPLISQFAVRQEFAGSHPDRVVTRWNLPSLASNAAVVIGLSAGAYRMIPASRARSFSLASLMKGSTAVAICVPLILIFAKTSSEGGYLFTGDDIETPPFGRNDGRFPPGDWLSWHGALLAVALYGTVLLGLDGCGAIFKSVRSPSLR